MDGRTGGRVGGRVGRGMEGGMTVPVSLRLGGDWRGTGRDGSPGRSAQGVARLAGSARLEPAAAFVRPHSGNFHAGGQVRFFFFLRLIPWLETLGKQQGCCQA